MELLGQVIGVAVLLVIGWSAGTIAERRHKKSIGRRKAVYSDMAVTEIRTFPGPADPGVRAFLVVAEAVIATDYLKTFLARIRKLLGGEVRSYLGLLERARDEALLRIMEQAREQGCDAVCNVRLESADIAGMTKRGAVTVGVIASGTAYRRRPEASS